MQQERELYKNKNYPEKIIKILDIRIFLQLLIMDFTIIKQHFILSTTDWEKRFFAKQGILLIYDIKEHIITPYKNILGIKHYNESEVKIKYNHFLQKWNLNAKIIKEIRDKITAHKKCNTSEQLELHGAIDTFSSYLFCEEVQKLLDHISFDFNEEKLNLLSKYNGNITFS